jgi:hypothetical protein
MNVKMRDIVPVSALVGLFTAATLAQAPAPTPAPAPAAPGMTITATSANVTGAGEKVEFYINRWSTDADRDKLATAWNTKPAPPPAAGARAGAAEGAAAPAGRGGGRGGRGGAAADATPRTPEAALAAAMKELTPAGYFWTSEVGGYLVRYAAKVPGTGGETRIVLLTDKRLGAAKNSWQPGPAAGAANSYEFSLIELRVPAKGDGEGKVSLTGTMVVDPGTKGLALENYDALPVTLRGVTMRAES